MMLFVPSASPPTALLLMLHGCTQSPLDFARGTRMNEWAERAGFAVLYPEQTAQANPKLCWNWFSKEHQQAGGGEPAFLLDITHRTLEELGCTRVFVAGLSAGACMAALLAHHNPSFFSGVALHSGVPLGAASSTLGALLAMRGLSRWGKNQSWSAPTLVFHGDKDNVVSLKNGQRLTEQACFGRNLSRREDTVSEGGRTSQRVRYGDEIEFWTVHGLGHAWSGGSPEGSWTDPAGPDASAHLLRFFGLAGQGQSSR